MTEVAFERECSKVQGLLEISREKEERAEQVADQAVARGVDLAAQLAERRREAAASEAQATDVGARTPPRLSRLGRATAPPGESRVPGPAAPRKGVFNMAEGEEPTEECVLCLGEMDSGPGGGLPCQGFCGR